MSYLLSEIIHQGFSFTTTRDLVKPTCPTFPIIYAVTTKCAYKLRTFECSLISDCTVTVTKL